MKITDAMAILATMHDDVQVGQGAMTIPVEIVEAVLELWASAGPEYAEVRRTAMANQKVIWEAPYASEDYVIGVAKQHNNTLVRRRVIELDDWVTLSEAVR